MQYCPSLESAKIPFTLPMTETKTTVLVFGFSFPFSAGFQGKSGFSFAKKWFLFLASVLPKRRGWGICPRRGGGCMPTPNMTGRRFHRTTEVIPRRPWKSQSRFASRPIQLSINKGMRGARARARHDVALPPFISIVPSPGRPVVFRCKKSKEIQHKELWAPKTPPPLKILYVGLFPVFWREKRPQHKELRGQRSLEGGGGSGRGGFLPKLFMFMLVFGSWRIKFLPQGASKYAPRPPGLPWKMPLARYGGGEYHFHLEDRMS